MSQLNRCLLAVLLGSSAAWADDFSWQLIRPSNTGIPGDLCYSLFIDDDDSPWVSGFITFWAEGGVGHFDGNAWRVLSNVECSQIANPAFNEIAKTPDGVMWIATQFGLLRFDPAVEPWCVTRFDAFNTPMADSWIDGIDVAPDGTLWLAVRGTNSSAHGGLGHYDPASDTWEFWNTSNGVPWWAGWDWVQRVAVQPDAAGGYTVWFSSDTMGLVSFSNGVFTRHSGPGVSAPSLLDILGKHPVDDAGNMLMSTDQGWAVRAPDGTLTVIPNPPIPVIGFATIDMLPAGQVIVTSPDTVQLYDGVAWTNLGHWGGNETLDYGQSSEGDIWVCGIGGAAVYSQGMWQRYRLTNTGMLDYFAEDMAFAPNGDVAMTANAGPGVGGFDILHSDGSWTNANSATYGLGLPWPYPTDNTSALAFRANNNLLFAPSGYGLYEYDGVGFNAVYPDGDFEYLIIAGDGKAWGAGEQFWLYRENPFTGMDEYTYADGVPVGRIIGLVADPDDPHSVWVGSVFGLARTDGTTWTQYPRELLGLTVNTTSQLLTGFDVAPDGTLWVASGVGLFHYDPATGLYDKYDLTNTPLPSDDFSDVEIAPDGSVWVSFMPELIGVARFKDGEWMLWQQGSSPLPHNQINHILTRPTTGSDYEVWITCASEAIAVMTVDVTTCQADLTGDGVLDFFDVLEFLSLFTAQDPSADINADGEFNFFDVLGFLDLFSAGCP
ncbi:MAG: hypothetical protein D6695_08025 [Planctomycetota bacterium]|nr:MAG: hypothetical protein D6695_08025 [Planctomycetota bacterium]